jgi:hypothetical protein
VKKLVLAAALIAAPFAARADTGLRIGLEAQIASHDDTTGTTWITDNWPLAGDVMLSYWTPGSIVSFDLELSEQFFLSSANGAGSGRIGTVIRPGVRISPPVIPIYIRGALPINVETAMGERELLDLRVGAGVNIPLVLFKLYIELDADFPLSSKSLPAGGSQISAFNRQSIWLTSGLDFRF